MRDSKANFRLVRNSSGSAVRALRLAAVALGIGLVMATGAARAQEDDDDNKTFEEKIIGGLMSNLRGTNMDSRGIDYRERSPLVVPPKIDLPPPVTQSTEVNVPNWPKDPDEARRKAAKKVVHLEQDKDPLKASQIIQPSEPNNDKTASTSASSGTGASDTLAPGGEASRTAVLSSSQLVNTGGLFKMFHGDSPESAPFQQEPPRETLTQPPFGYQTPSPDYAYGTGGPKEAKNKDNSAAGKNGGN
jgi:hypothetical protein